MRRVTEATLCTLLLAVVGTRSAAAGTITGVAAGSGLLGGGTNGAVILSANYGGDGVAQRVCHADHTHAGNTWNIYDIPIGLELAMHCTARDSSCAQVAVAGVALGAPGTGAGVYGSTDAVLGLGVWGENLAPSGKSIGIAGIAKSPDGIGVVGTASKTTGSPLGVQGNVVAPLGTGVQGLNYAVTGTGVGVSGKSFAPSGMGVSGLNLASTGSAIGVDGESLSSAGYGGYFRNQAGGTALRVRVEHPTASSKYITASNGAYLSAGGAWTNSSDVNLKDHFASVDDSSILQKLRALPVDEWSYKTEGDSVRHIGPTAQDFRAAFALGTDDTTITTIDEAGIALAAIQELDRRTAEIAQLKERLARLEATVLALQAAARP